MLDLNHAITLEPRNYSAFFELGITMEATERPQLAIKATEKAREYTPQMRKASEAHSDALRRTLSPSPLNKPSEEETRAPPITLDNTLALQPPYAAAWVKRA